MSSPERASSRSPPVNNYFRDRPSELSRDTVGRSPFTGCRLPIESISRAVRRNFRFPLGPRMVEELLATRGIAVSHETVRF
jgi:hypothetical protein